MRSIDDVFDTASDDSDTPKREEPLQDQPAVQIVPNTWRRDREETVKRRRSIDSALKKGGSAAWTDAWPIKWGQDKFES